MPNRNHPFRRRSYLCALALVGVAASAAIAEGPGARAADPTRPAPLSTDAPGDRGASDVTMRNASALSVDLVLSTTASGEGPGGGELCKALEVAIRDRSTAQVVRTAPVGRGRPLRVARLAPDETAKYRAEIRVLPERQVLAGGLSDAVLQGASCPVGFAWSFAPTR